MFVLNAVFCLLFLSFGLNDGGILDNIEKCKLSDGECQKRGFMTLFRSNAHAGIPELNIPSFKPYVVKDASVSILGLTEFSVPEGLIEGMPNCEIKKYKVDVQEQIIYTENYCNQTTLKGHYKIVPGPFLSTLSTSSISGDGDGEIQINKMILKMKIPFHIEKHEDGEIYVVPIPKESKYSTDIAENITFAADNIIIGGENVGKTVTEFMNKNWQFILKSFGKFFSDIIMQEFYKGLEKVFKSIPAKDFIKGDLSSYLKTV